jgi:hypothetical protein
MVALLRCSFFALTAVVLAGCASSGCYPVAGTPIAWEGLGRSRYDSAPATKPKAKRQAKAETVAEPNYDAIDPSGVKPHSNEWWALREAADRAADAALARKLVICRGCLPPPAKDDDATASVTR